MTLNPKLYNPKLPEKVDLPELPIFKLLKGASKTYGDKIAAIHRDIKISFNELYNESLKFANALKEIGITKGDVVSVQLPNSLQTLIAYYGVQAIGAIYSPFNPFLPKRDIVNQMKDNNTKLAIVHEDFSEAFIEAAKEIGNIKMIFTNDREEEDANYFVEIKDDGSFYSFNQLRANSTPAEIDVHINPKTDLAHLIFTGGTTGKPKAVMHTHYNMVSSVFVSAATMGQFPKIIDDYATVEIHENIKDSFSEEYNMDPPGEGVMLSPAPLYHMGGLMSLNLNITGGRCAILIRQFNPTEFLEFIPKYKVTCISGAPPMFAFLLSHPNFSKTDLSTIKTINSATAPITEALFKRLMEAFPNALVIEGYGLTEATAGVAGTPSFKDGLRKLGTVGVPYYNCELKIVDVSGVSDEPLPPNQRGEVWVRGPIVAIGYYNNPDATAETFTPDGWLKTGDIGVIDEDGCLSIVDRKKEMIIYNGYNVYPRYLEEILYEMDGVIQAAVIGLPDEVHGEIPAAYVVKKQGSNITEENIFDFVNSKVVHYAKLRKVEFVDQLPQTAAGKISKVALKKMVTG